MKKLLVLSMFLPLVLISNGENRWGSDVQVSNVDNIYNAAFEMDYQTGNLFAVAAYPDSVLHRWCLYFSSDSGQTWEGKYLYTASEAINDISISVMRNRAYVMYNTQEDSVAAYIMRFYTDDASVDIGYGIDTVYNSGPGIREIALASDVDYSGLNNRLFCYLILDNDSLKCFHSDSGGTNWMPINTYIDDADRALDACYNHGYYYLQTSYINIDDSIKVAGKIGFCRHDIIYSDYVGNFNDYKTSISSYNDTTVVVYNYWDGGVTQLKAVESFDYGSTWDTYFIGNPAETNCVADVTARRGKGMAVSYFEYVNTDVECFFTNKYYDESSWNAPVNFNDYEPNCYIKPEIEYISDSTYGVVYVDFPSGFLYFDKRSALCGINGEKTDDAILEISRNPSFANTVISFSLSGRENISLEILDVTGREVRNVYQGFLSGGNHRFKWNGRDDRGHLMPGGIYFCVLKGRNWSDSKKLIVMK